MPRTSRSATITTDHDEIRRWAEEHGGTPAAVKRRTRGDAGILRIDFPGFTGKNLQKISWDEWFETFDAANLALLHRDQDRFNKLVRRSEPEEHGRARARGRTKTKTTRPRATHGARGTTRRATKRTRSHAAPTKRRARSTRASR